MNDRQYLQVIPRFIRLTDARAMIHVIKYLVPSMAAIRKYHVGLNDKDSFVLTFVQKRFLNIRSNVSRGVDHEGLRGPPYQYVPDMLQLTQDTRDAAPGLPDMYTIRQPGLERQMRQTGKV